MKTNWDYSNLAEAYLKRPDYSEDAINEMLAFSKISPDIKICDVGAGIAHLTIMLLKRGFNVTAIEPNDAMRAIGIIRTKKYNHSSWIEGTGEDTGQLNSEFGMVTFGSSFNVCDRQQALKETVRILKPKGWFACMWNHRDVSDNIQSEIESIIKNSIEDYGYGTRREDQTEEINKSGLFKEVKKIEGHISHQQTIAECVEAWKSHATLERQAGKKFHGIINEIENYLNSLNTPIINIPYTTRIWLAQVK